MANWQCHNQMVIARLVEFGCMPMIHSHSKNPRVKLKLRSSAGMPMKLGAPDHRGIILMWTRRNASV
jgi:hypothetical protein